MFFNTQIVSNELSGYTKDGAAYCEACKPNNYESVIFHTDETEFLTYCNNCSSEIRTTIF